MSIPPAFSASRIPAGNDAVSVSMKNTHHNRITELVITSEPLFA